LYRKNVRDCSISLVTCNNRCIKDGIASQVVGGEV
jgi:hypothetical protein